MHNDLFSSREVADFLGLPHWKIRRVFELGLLAEPPRIGGRRIIDRALLTEILRVARKRGWISDEAEVPP